MCVCVFVYNVYELAFGIFIILHAWLLLYYLQAHGCIWGVCVCVCVVPKGIAPDGLKTMNNLSDPLIVFSDSISSWSNQAGEAVHV